jgi:hypothetical protein
LLIQQSVELDGWAYDLEVLRPVCSGPDVVKLIIPAYQPNSVSSDILRVCIEAIRRFTLPDEYELWVVDSNSSPRMCAWLRDVKGVNLVFNRTEPRPPEERGVFRRKAFWRNQTKWGSYANAVGLELAIGMMPKETKWIMTLHMDTMPLRNNWLTYLRSKLAGQTKAVGICAEKNRTPEGVLHILGCLMDFELVKNLGLTFFPELPKYDVGDKITIGFRKKNFDVFCCRNTYNNPEYAETVSVPAAIKDLRVVKVFDDEWNVIFAHLGRGVPKSVASYQGKTASADEWVRFAEQCVISANP